MLTIYKRSRTWWARGTLRGHAIRRSLHTRDRQMAKTIVHRMELESHGIERHACSWSALAEEVLSLPSLKPRTLKKYRFVFNRFGEFLGPSRMVASVMPADVGRYSSTRRSDLHPTRGIPVGPEGIKSDLRILRRAFSVAIAHGYCASNPVRVGNLNTPPGRTMPFTREETDRMLRDRMVLLRPELRCILLLFLTTGLRISDVISLRWDQVGKPAGYITVKTEKRGKIVMLPIHPELQEGLSALPRTGSPLVFPTRQGHPMTSLAATLYRMWDRCGIEGAHPHRFRDTFACRMLEVGASLYDVSKLLGITMGTAERHYAPYVEELRERGKRLVGRLQVQIPYTSRASDRK